MSQSGVHLLNRRASQMEAGVVRQKPLLIVDSNLLSACKENSVKFQFPSRERQSALPTDLLRQGVSRREVRPLRQRNGSNEIVSPPRITLTEKFYVVGFFIFVGDWVVRLARQVLMVNCNLVDDEPTNAIAKLNVPGVPVCAENMLPICSL